MARNIVEATIGLGHTLAMTCVAEGVETSAQRDLLVALGCDVGQGYLWSRRLRAEALYDWLGRGTGEPYPPAYGGDPGSTVGRSSVREPSGRTPWGASVGAGCGSACCSSRSWASRWRA